MSSYNDHLIANERLKQYALISVAQNMRMDSELMSAIANTGYYMQRLLSATVPSDISRDGSTLEKLVMSRLSKVMAND